MRVAIVGAGAVGRSIARGLLRFGHKVLLIEHERIRYRPHLVPAADWLLADACELDALEAAGIATCDAVIASSGDDRVNLVFSLLAKTEFGVPRVVARVNHPRNEWLFTEAWGVDTVVSTPRTLADAVKNAATLLEVTRHVGVGRGLGSVVGVTVPPEAPVVGRPASSLRLPAGAALASVLRGGQVLTADADLALQPEDELIMITTGDVAELIRTTLGEVSTIAPPVVVDLNRRA